VSNVADIDPGEFPNQFLGLAISTNGTTGTAENLVAAPLKLNTEAISQAGNLVGASLHSGSGSPNGTVAAGTGSFYLRWDTPSTANQRLYVCTSGSAVAASAVWVGIA
jgi:hypothetical protein